jgi:hypothetical protein
MCCGTALTFYKTDTRVNTNLTTVTSQFNSKNSCYVFKRSRVQISARRRAILPSVPSANHHRFFRNLLRTVYLQVALYTYTFSNPPLNKPSNDKRRSIGMTVVSVFVKARGSSPTAAQPVCLSTTQPLARIQDTDCRGRGGTARLCTKRSCQKW